MGGKHTSMEERQEIADYILDHPRTGDTSIAATFHRHQTTVNRIRRYGPDYIRVRKERASGSPVVTPTTFSGYDTRRKEIVVETAQLWSKLDELEAEGRLLDQLVQLRS